MYVPDIHAFYVSCGLRLMLEIPIEYEGIIINVVLYSEDKPNFQIKTRKILDWNLFEAFPSGPPSLGGLFDLF